jgi:hypothetical protein
VSIDSAHGNDGCMLHVDCRYDETGVENDNTKTSTTMSAIIINAQAYTSKSSIADCAFLLFSDTSNMQTNLLYY